MEYFQVRYNYRVVIYEHKMFIRLANGLVESYLFWKKLGLSLSLGSFHLTLK